jgi:hypothetical protein
VTPLTVTTRLAFLCACDVLVGLKTTLMMQLSPAASVVPAQKLDAMVKLDVLHPVATFVQLIVALPVPLNSSGTLPELITCTS